MAACALKGRNNRIAFIIKQNVLIAYLNGLLHWGIVRQGKRIEQGSYGYEDQDIVATKPLRLAPHPIDGLLNPKILGADPSRC